MITSILVFFIVLVLTVYMNNRTINKFEAFSIQMLFSRKMILPSIKNTAIVILVFLNIFCVCALFKSPYQQNVQINDISKTEFSLNDFDYKDLNNGTYEVNIEDLNFTISKDSFKTIKVSEDDARANKGVYTESTIENKLEYKNGFCKFIIEDFFLDKSNLFKNNATILDKKNKNSYSDIILYTCN